MNYPSRTTRIGAAAAVVALASAACGASGGSGSGGFSSSTSSAGGTSGAYSFGVLNAMTGALGVVGQQESQGMNLAVDQINSAGGVNGHKLKLISIDDQGQVSLSTAGFKKLATSDHVPVILGPGISAAAAADAPLADQYGVTEILLVAQPSTANGTKYVFETPSPQSVDSQAMVNYAKAKGAKTAAIIWAANPYGQEGTTTLSADAKKAGINVVSSESWDPTKFDFTAQAGKVAGENPDVVFLYGAGGASDGLLLKAVATSGYQGLIVGDIAYESSTIPSEAGNAAASRIVAPTPVNVANPNTKQTAFINAFKAKYSKDPTVLSADAYAAVEVAAAALKKAGSANGPAIAKALEGLNYKSIVGTMAYTSRYHAGPSDPSIWTPVTFKDGAYATASG